MRARVVPYSGSVAAFIVRIVRTEVSLVELVEDDVFHGAVQLLGRIKHLDPLGNDVLSNRGDVGAPLP